MYKEKHRWIKYFTREHYLFEILVINKGYTKGMKKEIGWGFNNVLFIARKGLETSYRGKEDERQFYDFLKKKMKTDKNFILRICSKIIDYSRKGIKIGKDIKKKKLEKINKKDLLKDFNNLYSIYRKFWSVYVFPMYVEKIFSKRNIQMIKSYKRILIEAKKGSEYAYPIIQKACEKLFKEIARRLKINKTLILYAFPREIKNFLISNRLFNETELYKRYEYYLLMTRGGKTNIYTGEKAKEIEEKEISIYKLPKEIKEIKGQIANKGKAIKGKVKIILYKKDYSKIQLGDILVTPMTKPDYIPSIKKAIAIVTDEGGITCHAAIVSRELDIPCIVGTKIATKVLKDGDLVEVDANKGIVKIIKKAKIKAE